MGTRYGAPKLGGCAPKTRFVARRCAREYYSVEEGAQNVPERGHPWEKTRSTRALQGSRASLIDHCHRHRQHCTAALRIALLPPKPLANRALPASCTRQESTASMKTKPGGRAARTDLAPEIPEELKALDDAALLDALETQPPAVATRALHERLRKRPAPSDAFKAGARVLLARIVFRTPSSHAATAAAAYGFSGPDGALLLEALRGALEKTSSTNAFTNAAARALVVTDSEAYKREEWPLAAKVALVHAAAKTLKNTDAASQICADASRNADDDVTRAAALDALTALAKRSQSCRGIASQAAGEALRRPLDRRRFAAAGRARRLWGRRCQRGRGEARA